MLGDGVARHQASTPTPSLLNPEPSTVRQVDSVITKDNRKGDGAEVQVQGYLAHKNPPPPRSLQ